MSSIWSEIRTDFEDDIRNLITVDAWKSGDDDEVGKVISEVSTETGNVQYMDDRARTDEMTQIAIGSAVDIVHKRKEKVVDAVIVQIKEDISNGDCTVLDELLNMISKTNLIQALPEERWSEFE